ncbi:MAG: DUF3108 domain-containing protein [Dehalococcoidia bacterium]|nr:DUF3108 domain-containing protein [Dehalococcoidia bacterium]
MSRIVLILASAVLFAAAVAGCGGGEDKVLTKVFVAPPWATDETNEYNLVIEDGSVYGTCVLETRLKSDGTNTRLNKLCGDGENRDDGTVLVDPATLRPLSANRSQVQPEKDQRLSFSSFYEFPIVKFVADENGKQRETTRELPQPDDTSPDPGYYDDESLLWLVRGIDLREGYEASYQNVSAGTGQTFTVDILVEGQEQVRVPLGEFAAWKVRIHTASVTQYVWIETEGAHRLIQARIKGIQDVTYKMTRSE